jgi:hypothetical protein
MLVVKGSWACIAWDMKRRQITIHAAGNRDGNWSDYEKIVTMLNSAFRRCIESFFDGWSVDWEEWARVYTTSSSPDVLRPDG